MTSATDELWYIDTSALVKLVIPEAGSTALRDWIESDAPGLLSSDLTRTELARTLRRFDWLPASAAHDLLEGLRIVPLPTAIFDRAGRLDPPVLHSLDAVHITAALDLGDDLRGLVSYDERMAEAARAVGIRVIAPA